MRELLSAESISNGTYISRLQSSPSPHVDNALTGASHSATYFSSIRTPASFLITSFTAAATDAPSGSSSGNRTAYTSLGITSTLKGGLGHCR